jgi:predicted lipid-binding transport protein (Tim44 family)
MSHFGFGGALGEMLGSILLIAALAIAGLFVFRLLRGARPAPGPQPVYAGAPPPPPGAFRVVERPAVGNGLERGDTVSVTGEPLPSLAPAGETRTPASTATWSLPADFDVEGFLRSAKVYFVRLQAAWDAGDQADIREFTTPEMFAEIKLDLTERGAAPNQTDVVQIEAELLGIEEQGRNALASVRFHGLLREAPGAAVAPFSEVWNLVKPLSDTHGWLLAGIQQVAPA